MIVQVDSRVDYDYDLVYLIVKKLIFGIAIVLLFLPLELYATPPCNVHLNIYLLPPMFLV